MKIKKDSIRKRIKILPKDKLVPTKAYCPALELTVKELRHESFRVIQIVKNNLWELFSIIYDDVNRKLNIIPHISTIKVKMEENQPISIRNNNGIELVFVGNKVEYKVINKPFANNTSNSISLIVV